MNQLVANGSAAARKPLRQVENVRELLVNDQAREQLAKVAARHLNPERMMRVMANAVRTTPALGTCEPMTLLGALMQCATLGLEPNTPLGHAYLIPFGKAVTLVVGYKGLADMARRSGHVTAIHADVVYSDDELWDYEYGSAARLRHKPGPREGTKLAAYCHAKLTDGEAFVVLPWAEVLKVRNASQGYKRAVQKADKTAPWIAHEDAMARKTALRALANRGELPISVEFMQAAEVDEARVDFAGFARHPEEGAMIEGSAEAVEDDATVVEGQAEAKPAENAEKPKKEARAQAAAKGAETPHDADGVVTEPKAGVAPERRAALEGFRDRILQDAEVDAAGARGFHAGKLASLRAEAPDLFREVEEELAAFVAAQAERGEGE